MYKRDAVEVVLRVAGTFAFFTIIFMMPEIISIWSYALTEASLFSKIFRTILLAGVPIGSGIILWSRSEWIAERVLAPFNIGEPEIDEQEKVREESIVPDSHGDKDFSDEDIFSVEKIGREELMTIGLTVIAAWLFIDSLPSLISVITMVYLLGNLSSSLDTSSPLKYLLTIAAPLCKTLLSLWLFFGAGKLMRRVNRRRDLPTKV
jgi:hypothetical protein